MNKIFPFVAVACFAFFSLSCERCETCKVKESSGIIIYEYTEQCGTKEELDNFEKSCNNSAGLYTCECN